MFLFLRLCALGPSALRAAERRMSTLPVPLARLMPAGIAALWRAGLAVLSILCGMGFLPLRFCALSSGLPVALRVMRRTFPVGRRAFSVFRTLCTLYMI